MKLTSRARPFLHFTRRDAQKFRLDMRHWLVIVLHEARRLARGYGTLDEIAQRRREMFAEIMGTRYRRVTAHMKAVDIMWGGDLGTVRQTPKPPPMRRPSDEAE